jgi:CBS domain containing-hemolysin-like protein
VVTTVSAGIEHYLTWLGIAFCLSQSAMFSGLNLAFFSMSRLRLEIEQANGNVGAGRILALRRDSNFLLTLLADSVMTGVVASRSPRSSSPWAARSRPRLISPAMRSAWGPGSPR